MLSEDEQEKECKSSLLKWLLFFIVALGIEVANYEVQDNKVFNDPVWS